MSEREGGGVRQRQTDRRRERQTERHIYIHKVKDTQSDLGTSEICTPEQIHSKLHQRCHIRKKKRSPEKP